MGVGDKDAADKHLGQVHTEEKRCSRGKPWGIVNITDTGFLEKSLKFYRKR